MSKIKLNPATDIPTSKKQITKDFMIGYLKEKGTKAEKEWYVKLCNQYKVQKTSTLPTSSGITIESYDFNEIKKEFIKKFFPQLEVSKLSYSNQLDELLK